MYIIKEHLVSNTKQKGLNKNYSNEYKISSSTDAQLMFKNVLEKNTNVLNYYAGKFEIVLLYNGVIQKKIKIKSEQ